jgi:hypothetical protein
MSEQEKGPGRLYRVVERFPWIAGGRPAPGGWEGGEVVVYEPGQEVYLEDLEVERGLHYYLEGIDDAGRAALEELRAKAKAPAITALLLDAEQRSNFAWGLADAKERHGELELKEALISAIRNGYRLPDDREFREWFADALEGKFDPKRGKGRPRKKPRRDPFERSIENHIVNNYRKWLAAFQDDRELAWLRLEALRLQEEFPDAAVWSRLNHLGSEEGRRSFETTLAELGLQRCPPEERGGETPHELALKATVAERRAIVGEDEMSSTAETSSISPAIPLKLTPDIVRRIITRAQKNPNK